MNVNKKKKIVSVLIASVCIILVGTVISYILNHRNSNTSKDSMESNSETASINVNNSSENLELEGEGTMDSPYLISSCRDFQTVSNQIKEGNNLKGLYFCLTSDIDMERNPYLYPLGEGKEFAGIFDGNGYGLTNVEMDNRIDIALFGELSGIVANLSLKEGRISGGVKTGAFAIDITEEGRLLNCINYITVQGEYAGGLAFSSVGSIINCGYFGDNEEGHARAILASVENDCENGARIENTYTSRSGLLEITNFGSEEMKKTTHITSIKCLNQRVSELPLEFPECKFNFWDEKEEWPYITDERVFSVEQVKYKNSDTEIAANYDVKQGKWCFDGIDVLQPGTITITTDFDEITILTNEPAYGINSSYKKGEITVTAGNEQKEALLDKTILYYDVDNFVRKEIIHSIIAVGNYEFSGNENGQIIIDLKKNDKSDGKNDDEDDGKEINIELNNLVLTTEYGCAILNTSKKDLNIHIADGSNNVLTGMSTTDIHKKNQKYGGVISSRGNIEISGDTGSLTINSNWEGIDGEKSFKVSGGNISIKSLDDGVSMDDDFEINAGKMLVDGGDDAFDTKKAFINGGIVIGDAPHEGMVNTEGTTFNGGLFVGSCMQKGKFDDGSNIIMEISFKHRLDEEVYLLLTDDKDNPVLAYKMNVKTRILTYGDENLKEGKYKAYVCSNVTGEWEKNYCKNVKEYEIVAPFITEDGEILNVKKGANIFEEREDN